MDGFPLWPDSASNFSGQVDAIYITLITISALLTLPIVGLIIYFGVKYRRGSTATRGGWKPGHIIEFGWIGGLFVLIVPIYLWSASVYVHMFRPPANAIDVYVIGKQWMWQTQHTNGRREINQLHVPVGRAVRLTMTSQDVIHSFYVPAFRLKHDVLPGRYTTLWFEPTKTGTFHLFCAEFCGTEHSAMGGDIIVMEQAAYQAWLNEGDQASIGANNADAVGTVGQARQGNLPGGQLLTPGSMASAGAMLFQRAACISCHRMEGGGAGPSLVGVYNATVPLQSGAAVRADEEYIRESIVVPNAKIVAGYPAIMPSFQGQFTNEELMELVEYVKSLGGDK